MLQARTCTLPVVQSGWLVPSIQRKLHREGMDSASVLLSLLACSYRVAVCLPSWSDISPYVSCAAYPEHYRPLLERCGKCIKPQSLNWLS